MEKMESLRERFKNPPVQYRSAPFWSWNDKLDAEELVRQVRDMKEHGMGGFFMHSREGLETEYMGPEWMHCVRETAKAAAETGMGAWIYDEDRWPSGAAGGLVPAKGGDAYRAKGLTVEVRKEEYTPDDRVLAVFKAVVDGTALVRCEKAPVRDGLKPAGDEVLLVFRREVSGPSEWFNDDAYADNLNPEAVQAFIETTYEVYKKEVGEYFGKSIPGVFTDEPNISDGHCAFEGNRGWIPWTDGFTEYFRQRRGYDFLDLAPYVFFDGEKASKIRHDFWRTITERFCEAYSSQLGAWCGENGLAFTGHYLLENDLGAATRLGGAIMPHYRYQHVPGIDMLCEQTHEQLTVKQCTSVANQYGRERVLSETYGCTGWEFTFEGQKWVGDWQYVLGVNLRCQHLALYSLRGCRKRDYPPVFNYNTSWWKYNNLIEDYFARISAVMSQGKAVREVLVLHPSTTAWSMLGANPQHIRDRWADPRLHAINLYGEEINSFARHLLGMHYDFDFGDEMILEEKGRVEGDTLYVNLAGYKVVVIPRIQTLLGSTVRLLQDFMDAGGRVIVLEPLPTMVEGEVSGKIAALLSHKQVLAAKDKAEAVALLAEVLPRQVGIRNRYLSEAPEFLYMLRDLPDCRSLFIVNNDRNNSFDVDIALGFRETVEEWDLLTGGTTAVAVSAEGGGITFPAHFGPADSKLYVIAKDAAAMPSKAAAPQYFNYHLAVPVHGALGLACSFTRTLPNALTLDRCSFRLNGGEWSEEAEVWKAQRRIREALGMRQVYYNGLPQRYKWVGEPHPKDGTPAEFKFGFYVADLPQGDVFLALEAAQDYEVRLNGNSVVNKPEGWFVDRAVDKIRLSGLKQGSNELVLSCAYLNRMEVEDCYLLGNFGVDTGRNIVKEPETLHFGDWCLQGYPNYCGSVIYHFQMDARLKAGEKALLQLGEYSAVTVEIRVNGATAGYIPWRAANKVDITEFLKEGINKIDIEVMGSPRNLFGPFHQVEGCNMYTDWRSFRREGSEYTPEYVLKPYGLFGQVKILKG